MKPIDVHLWEEFIEQHPAFYEWCEYDVLVGNGVIAGDVEADPYAKSFQMLTQKKIDVVAYKGDAITIIEVKPLSGSAALGQLIGYKKLWHEANPDIDPAKVSMALITNLPQSDFAKIYQDLGIQLYEVGICDKCSGNLQI